MSNAGVRVELAVDSPEACPVANLADEAGADVTSVARSSSQADGRVVEEFTLADTNGVIDGHEDVEEVFATSDGSRYRIERDRSDCLCETVETFACPVADIRSEEGTLVLTFHAPDVDRTRAIIARLNDLYGGVSLRSLQHQGDADGTDAVLVDRSGLTDRQREVLETAVEMGYFEYPKGANASEVAEALGISVSTFAEHQAAALTKLLGPIVEA